MMKASRRQRQRPRQDGFTLLEVMVALLVLSIALAALVQSSSTTAANAAYLRDKTFAHWVALNRATENRLAHPWPPLGSKEGVEEMAGREWSWRVKVEKTEDDYVRKMTIEVRLEKDAGTPMSTLTAFLPRTGKK